MSESVLGESRDFYKKGKGVVMALLVWARSNTQTGKFREPITRFYNLRKTQFRKTTKKSWVGHTFWRFFWLLLFWPSAYLKVCKQFIFICLFIFIPLFSLSCEYLLRTAVCLYACVGLGRKEITFGKAGAASASSSSKVDAVRPVLIRFVSPVAGGTGVCACACMFDDGVCFEILAFLCCLCCVGQVKSERARAMMEFAMDYQDPGANTNPGSGYTLPPPPPTGPSD